MKIKNMLFIVVSLIAFSSWSHIEKPPEQVSGIITEESREWLEFDGSAKLENGSYTLSASKGGGILIVAVSDIVVSDSIVLIRKGASAKIANKPLSAEGSCMGTRACPRNNPCSTCIGAVILCCEGHNVVGACLGYWGCP
jgi:hypothetical protein